MHLCQVASQVRAPREVCVALRAHEGPHALVHLRYVGVPVRRGREACAALVALVGPAAFVNGHDVSAGNRFTTRAQRVEVGEGGLGVDSRGHAMVRRRPWPPRAELRQVVSFPPSVSGPSAARAPPPQRRHPDPAGPHSRRATRLACASRPHHGRAWDAQRSRGWRARAPSLRARWRGGRNGTASRRPERLPGPRAPRPVRAATRALSASRAAETPRLARPCKACTAGAAWSHG